MRKLALILIALLLGACSKGSGSGTPQIPKLDPSLIVSQPFTTGNLAFDFTGEAYPSAFGNIIYIIPSANSAGDTCAVQVVLSQDSTIQMQHFTASHACSTLTGTYDYYIVAEGSGIQAYLMKR